MRPVFRNSPKRTAAPPAPLSAAATARRRLLRLRERDLQRRPDADLAVDLALAVQRVDVRTDEEQPEPQVLRVVAAAVAAAVEGLEDLRQLVRVDALPGVGDRQAQRAVVAFGGEADGPAGAVVLD